MSDRHDMVGVVRGIALNTEVSAQDGLLEQTGSLREAGFAPVETAEQSDSLGNGERRRAWVARDERRTGKVATRLDPDAVVRGRSTERHIDGMERGRPGDSVPTGRNGSVHVPGGLGGHASSQEAK